MPNRNLNLIITFGLTSFKKLHFVCFLSGLRCAIKSAPLVHSVFLNFVCYSFQITISISSLFPFGFSFVILFASSLGAGMAQW